MSKWTKAMIDAVLTAVETKKDWKEDLVLQEAHPALAHWLIEDGRLSAKKFSWRNHERWENELNNPDSGSWVSTTTLHNDLWISKIRRNG